MKEPNEVVLTEEQRKQMIEYFSDPEHELEFWAVAFPHYTDFPFADFHKRVQRMLVSPTGKKLFILPRGFAKSKIVVVFHSIWSLLFTDHHYVIAATNTHKLAVRGLMDPIKHELAHNPLIKALFGDLEGGREDPWGAEMITLVFKDEKGIPIDYKRMEVFGIGMSMRGRTFRKYRPDLVIGDDIEDDIDVDNPNQRERMKQWIYDQVLPAISLGSDVFTAADFACTPTLILSGTLLHYDSALNNIFTGSRFYFDRNNIEGEDNGWDAFEIGVWYETDGIRKSSWPERFTLKFWDDKLEWFRRAGRESAFWKEHMNKVTPETERPINTDLMQWLKTEEREIISKDLVFYVALDMARSKQNRRRDYNEVGVLGVNRQTGNKYLFERSSYKSSDASMAVQAAVELAIEYRATKILYERAGLQNLVEDLIKIELKKRGTFVLINGVSTGNLPKEERARLTIGYEVDQKRFYLSEGMRDVYVNLVEFPSGAHDDVVDMLSLAIAGSDNKINSFTQVKKEQREKTFLEKIIQRSHDGDVPKKKSKFSLYHYR